MEQAVRKGRSGNMMRQTALALLAGALFGDAVSIAPLTPPLYAQAPAAGEPKGPESAAGAIQRFNAAATLYKKKEYELAAAEWKTLLEKFPTDPLVPDSLYFVGQALTQQQQWEAAAASLRNLVSKHPKSKYAEPGVTALVWALLKQVDRPEALQEAATVCTSALAAYPESKNKESWSRFRGEAYLALGEHYTAKKEWVPADAAFRKSLEETGFSGRDYALYRLAALEVGQKKYDAVAPLVDRLTKDFPQSEYVADAQLLAGRTAMFAKNYPEAQRFFAPLAAQPKAAQAPPAAAGLVKALLAANQPAQAQAAAEKALAVKEIAAATEGAEIQFSLAEALYQQPATKAKSTAAYERLAAAYPNSPLVPQALYYAAFAAFEVKDYASAGRLCEQFLKQFPKDDLRPDALLLGAESARGGKDFNAAAARFRELREQHAKHAKAAKAVLGEAECLAEAKDVAGALKLLGTIDGYQPTPDVAADAWVFGGGLLRQKQEWAQARGWYEKALAADPKGSKQGQCCYYLGLCSYRLNDFAAAKKHWEQVATSFPEPPFGPEAPARLAETALAQGDYAAVKPQVEKYLKVAPADRKAAAWLTLAQAEHGLKAWKEGAAACESGLKAEPAADLKAQLRYWQGLCFIGAKDPKAAAAVLEKLAADGPPEDIGSQAWYELGWVRRDLADAPGAAVAFEKSASTYPQAKLAGEGWFEAAQSWYAQKKYPESAKRYQQALDSNLPEEFREQARHKLGWSAYHQQDWAGAERAFAEQLKAAPTGELAADAMVMRARALLKLGKYPQALELEEAALKAYGQEPPTEKATFVEVLLLDAAQASGKQEKPDWEKSLRFAQQFLSRFPKSGRLPEALFAKAQALENLGQIEAALSGYQAVTDASDEPSEIVARAWYMHGEILFGKKQHKDAVRSFFKAAYSFDPAYEEWAANALFEAGRCFEVLMRLDQARDAYKELQTKYPQHPKAKLAAERAASLGKP